MGGDGQLPLIARPHQLQRLRPTRDHLIGRERGRGPSLDRGVEDLAVRLQLALIMAFTRRRWARVLPLGVAGLDDLVLQAGGHLDETELLLARGCAFLRRNAGDGEYRRREGADQREELHLFLFRMSF